MSVPYRNIIINIEHRYESDYHPQVKSKIRRGCEFLETMINSKMFKNLVLNKYYIVPDGFKNKEEVYNKYMSGDFIMNFVIDDKNDLNRGFSVNKTNHEITARPFVMKGWSIPKVAAVIAHEYGHIIGFHHNDKFASTFLFMLQFDGEILFNKFYKKLKRKKIPKKNHWLYYEGDCWNFNLIKRLKFKKHKVSSESEVN